MVTRAPRPRSPLAATVALVALWVQTALPGLHSAQLDIDVATPLRCGHLLSDGSADSHALGSDDARGGHHDAEQCALCQAIQQGKRTIAAPGSTGSAHVQVQRTTPGPHILQTTGPILRTTAPRGPPLHS